MGIIDRFGIELIGDNFEVLVGRMMTQAEAHTRQQSMNYKSLGICLIGNFDLEPPPQRQWVLALRLVKSLLVVLKIPLEKVYGHRDFASYKTCPGTHFDMVKFRQALKDMRTPS